MFVLTLIAWSIVVATVVSRYPKFFKKITAYRISFESSDTDSEPDDDMVGHSSVSDTEKMENTIYSDSDYDSESDDLDSDSEFDPEQEEAAEILQSLKTSLDDYDKLPDYMKDFYEETVLSPKWMKMTEEEKRAKLDADLDNYRTKA